MADMQTQQWDEEQEQAWIGEGAFGSERGGSWDQDDEDSEAELWEEEEEEEEEDHRFDIDDEMPE